MSFRLNQQVRVIGNNPNNPQGKHFLKMGSVATVRGVAHDGIIQVSGIRASNGTTLGQGVMASDLEPLGITFFEFMEKMLDAFPDATYDEDNDGQLIIYTGLTADANGDVTPMGDI